MINPKIIRKIILISLVDLVLYSVWIITLFLLYHKNFDPNDLTDLIPKFKDMFALSLLFFGIIRQQNVSKNIFYKQLKHLLAVSFLLVVSFVIIDNTLEIFMNLTNLVGTWPRVFFYVYIFSILFPIPLILLDHFNFYGKSEYSQIYKLNIKKHFGYVYFWEFIQVLLFSVWSLSIAFGSLLLFIPFYSFLNIKPIVSFFDSIVFYFMLFIGINFLPIMIYFNNLDFIILNKPFSEKITTLHPSIHNFISISLFIITFFPFFVLITNLFMNLNRMSNFLISSFFIFSFSYVAIFILISNFIVYY